MIGTMTRIRRLVPPLLGVLLVSALSLPQAGAGPSSGADRVSPLAPVGSTPALIEAAVARGEIDRAAADRYLAAALTNPSALPTRYRSAVPWRGTLPLLALQRRAEAAGTTVARLAGAARGGNDGCEGYNNNKPRKRVTNHFLIRYDPDAIKGRLTIRNYARTLETSWSTEVGQFGWPKPPFQNGANHLYHVRIENLGTGLYGFVSTNGATAGFVGNNPATSWPDHDAYASCMVLNQDYRGFPSVPLKSLQSTAAHEFNHAVQFGEGGLTGVGAPDLVFVEAGATWMEDEVFDNADDNYFYLWPSLANSMGAYPENGTVYSYWITLRAITERYGSGVAGGGEDVMQNFWEETSREEAGNLEAMSGALQAEGISLADAFHNAAISIRFSRPCAGGYVYPYCLEEGQGYRNLVGSYGNDWSIGGVGGSGSGAVRDDYAARMVGLPKADGTYDVTLSNDDTGGELRASLVCDTGAALTVTALSQVAGPGDTASAPNFNSDLCVTVVLVVTNQDQHGANPSSSTPRDFSVETA
jgi:hypothetical protein